MFDFHQSNQVYFKYQYESTKQYIIPEILNQLMLNNTSKVLEIGCGEGGNLLCFAELGCQCVGIDLNKPKIDAGRKIFEDTEYKDTVSFIDDDIYNREAEYRNAFDVILLKDVIEHIHDQQKLINFMKLMLKPNGVIFFAFPPWYMPFGGHQQVMSKKIPSLTPFTHLLPMPLYKGYLKLMGESKQGVENLAEIKDTGISIERFERCVKKSGMEIKFKKLYFINPNYKWKFGLKPKRVWPALTHIPFLKNFYTTTAYYMVGTKA